MLSAIGMRSAHAAPKLAALKPKPGYVMGRCVKMNGQPMPNVNIFIKGLTMAGQNTETFAKTKANGVYSMRVPAGLYSVYADHKVSAYGESYAFRLAPLDGESDTQDSSEGVREISCGRLAACVPARKPRRPASASGTTPTTVLAFIPTRAAAMANIPLLRTRLR
jgi:hypothetical protein